jgi:hypothetical protein
VLRVRGYRFFFFSRQPLEPPHIHVAQAERYAKLWLDPISVANMKGFRANEMTEIRKIVVENWPLFLERWHEYFGGENWSIGR